MGLSSVIANAVKTAKTVAGSLLVDVILEVRLGDEKDDEKTAGRRLYDDPVTYNVLVESKTKFVRIEDGIAGAQVSAIQFLDPLMIKTRDKITMPDGSHPQIMSVEGVLNPAGLYYAPKVYF